LGSLSAFGPLSIDMYLPGLPALRREFETGASQTQLTLSACLLGLAVGQVVIGPASDALGRRRPLLVALAGYAVASLLCATAPSVSALVALRFAQGFAGAGGIVIARAIVRDLHSGVAAARFYSLLMLVNGSAPILAPLFGGQLLRVTDWRGVFVVLALIGAVLLVAAALGLDETVAPEARQPGGIRATLGTFRRLLGDRAFVGYALSAGLAIAAMFAYIAGSPFVLQDIYGVSPQRFSLAFGVNALGLVVAGQINGRLVGRVPLIRLLTAGLTAIAVGGVALLVVVLAGIGLVGILPALFVVVASLGFVLPNSTALALTAHKRTAGSASALLGVLQYAVGAAAAPLVGIAGETTARPMAVVIATLGAAALAAFLLLARAPTEQPSSQTA
jgi:DHA1 family bicyclomycin/chloramphenicol resistance-like MFS transporter